MRIAALEHRLEADLLLGAIRTWWPSCATSGAPAARAVARDADDRPVPLRAGRSRRSMSYRATRAELIEAFGLEPGPELREMEQAILRQDPALAPPAPDAPAGEPAADGARRRLGPGAVGRCSRRRALALPPPQRELIIALLVPDETALGAAMAARSLRETLGSAARTAAFVSPRPGDDLSRLVRSHEPDLVLLDAPPGFATGAGPSPELTRALRRARATSRSCRTGAPAPRAAAWWCRSRAASTTGRRPSSAPGSPPPRASGCSSPARGRTRAGRAGRQQAARGRVARRAAHRGHRRRAVPGGARGRRVARGGRAGRRGRDRGVAPLGARGPRRGAQRGRVRRRLPGAGRPPRPAAGRHRPARARPGSPGRSAPASARRARQRAPRSAKL